MKQEGQHLQNCLQEQGNDSEDDPENAVEQHEEKCKNHHSPSFCLVIGMSKGSHFT